MRIQIRFDSISLSMVVGQIPSSQAAAHVFAAIFAAACVKYSWQATAWLRILSCHQQNLAANPHTDLVKTGSQTIPLLSIFWFWIRLFNYTWNSYSGQGFARKLWKFGEKRKLPSILSSIVGNYNKFMFMLFYRINSNKLRGSVSWTSVKVYLIYGVQPKLLQYL